MRDARSQTPLHTGPQRLPHQPFTASAHLRELSNRSHPTPASPHVLLCGPHGSSRPRASQGQKKQEGNARGLHAAPTSHSCILNGSHHCYWCHTVGSSSQSLSPPLLPVQLDKTAKCHQAPESVYTNTPTVGSWPRKRGAQQGMRI